MVTSSDQPPFSKPWVPPDVIQLFCKAAEEGNYPVVETCIEGFGALIIDAENGKALHWAATKEHLAVVRLLLDRGANVNAADKWGNTALGGATAWNKGTEVVALLLDRGAHIEARAGIAGWTPLLNAAREGNLAIVELLLSRGADIHARDKLDDRGLTALGWAEVRRRTKLVDFLRAYIEAQRLQEVRRQSSQLHAQRPAKATLKNRQVKP